MITPDAGYVSVVEETVPLFTLGNHEGLATALERLLTGRKEYDAAVSL